MTPVEKHGSLSVKGRELVDSRGDPVQLRGFSTHGIGWYSGFVCKETFQELKDRWGASCIRVALYPHEYNGYCTGGDQNELMGVVKKAIALARELGLYIIVDWHVLNERSPLVYKDQAKAFFSELCQEYKDVPNLIYEICNEPNGPCDWAQVKAYAEEIIPVIRNSTDAVVLVGSPDWSQAIDQAEKDRLGFDNIMYSLHFYAHTHRQPLRDRLRDCLGKGLPVFVSEFNITEATGKTDTDTAEGDLWMDLLDEFGLSRIFWAVCRSSDECSLLAPGKQSFSGWTYDELSPSGKWLWDRFGITL